jgi:hypothetical protein
LVSEVRLAARGGWLGIAPYRDEQRNWGPDIHNELLKLISAWIGSEVAAVRLLAAAAQIGVLIIILMIIMIIKEEEHWTRGSIGSIAELETPWTHYHKYASSLSPRVIVRRPSLSTAGYTRPCQDDVEGGEEARPLSVKTGEIQIHEE